MDENKALIIHTGTGVICGHFATHADAQHWLDGYRVSQSYKDQFYRIVGEREYWSRHSKLAADREVGETEPRTEV